MGKIREEADKLIAEFAGAPSQKQEEEPVAFGLKALKLVFIVDEDKGGTDNLEKELCTIPGVNSVDVIGLDRPLG